MVSEASDRPYLHRDGTYGVFRLNPDLARRDELLEGTAAGAEPSGGLRYFSGLSREALASLLAEGFVRAEDCQNDSPSVGEFLAYMQAHDGVTALGYAVGPARDDYRVSIEGIVLGEPYTEDQEAEFRAFCKGADELFENDDDWGRGLRAWWD